MWDEVKDDFQRFGWWLEGEDMMSPKRQRGVFRCATSCSGKLALQSLGRVPKLAALEGA